MKTIDTLRKQRADKIAEARSLVEASEDGTLGEDEQQRFDALMAESDKIQANIEREERLAKAEAGLEKRTELIAAGPDENEPSPRTNRRDVHWMRRTVRFFSALAREKESRAESERMLRSLKQDIAAMPEQQFKDELTEAEKIVSRSSLGDMAKLRLRALLDLGEFRTLTSADQDALGGDDLLPRPFLARLFVLTEQYGVARNIFTTIPYTGAGNTLSLKNLVTDVIAYWVDQAELIPPSDAEFQAQDLTLSKLAGVTSWTTEAEEDLMFSLMPIITQRFAERFAQKEDEAALVGAGGSSHGGFTGVVNLAGATVTNTGGTTNAITEGDLRAVKNSVSQHRRGNARWLMHESVLDNIRQLENSAGYRLFSETLSEGGAVNLLGHPVTFSEVMPAATTISGNNAPMLAFGDFGRVLMVIKRGMTADLDRSAVLQNPANGNIIFNAFQSDGAALRVTQRVGFATPLSVQGAIAVLQTEEGS